MRRFYPSNYIISSTNIFCSELHDDVHSISFKESAESLIFDYLNTRFSVLMTTPSRFKLSSFNWKIKENYASVSVEVLNLTNNKTCLKLEARWATSDNIVDYCSEFIVKGRKSNEEDLIDFVFYMSTNPSSDLQYAMTSKLETHQKMLMTEFLDYYKFESSGLTLYLYADSFNGWRSSKSVDLGLHLSYDMTPNRFNFGQNIYKIIINESMLKAKNIRDPSDFSTIDGFIDICNQVGIDMNVAEASKLKEHDRAKTSANFRKILLENNINALRYVDEYDSVGDQCICILDKNLILSYSKIQ